ncbi:MAG: hypothetical protein ACI8TQ_001456 [Planctomycetota bacterium]|jgi:hypothetical protein
MINLKEHGLELAILIAVLVAGWLLRVQNLEVYKMSPDDGSYLYSAGIARLDANADFSTAVSQDLEWWVPRYYPHSYLHQLAIRWSWRAGANAIFSVRIDSVILGLLSSLAIFLFSKRVLSRRHPAALVAAGIVALQCLHVWYSRTGWGTTGCAAFFAVYLALGYELVRRERSLLADLGIAIAMGLASLLAYGWHEMIVVHVSGMGLFILLHHIWGGPGIEGSGVRSLLGTLRRSQKAWAALLSALPILILFTVLLTSDFARQHWINFEDSTLKPTLMQILKHLFTVDHIEQQIAWPVLILAVIGYLKLRQTDLLASRYLGVSFLTSCLIFLLFFKDANLVRIYLPTALILAVLAGNGFACLCVVFKERWRSALSLVSALLFMAWMGMVSYQTIHDWNDGDEFFFEPRFHFLEGYEHVDLRDVHESTFLQLDNLLKPGEMVGVEALRGNGGVYGEFSILFKLRDSGFNATPFVVPDNLSKAGVQWPRFLMGVKRGMEQRGHTTTSNGRYREIGADRLGRVALYELEPKAE